MDIFPPGVAQPFPTGTFGDFWTGSICITPMPVDKCQVENLKNEDLSKPPWTLRFSGLVEAWNGNAGLPGFPNTNDTGYSVNASRRIFRGVTVGAAYAAWNGHSAPATTVSSSAWEVWANLDLNQAAGVSTWSPLLSVSYKNYGTAGATCGATTNSVCPIFSAAMTDTAGAEYWNF